MPQYYLRHHFPHRTHHPCPICRQAHLRAAFSHWLQHYRQQQQQLLTTTTTTTATTAATTTSPPAQSPSTSTSTSTSTTLSTATLAQNYFNYLEAQLANIGRRTDRQEREIRSVIDELERSLLEEESEGQSESEWDSGSEYEEDEEDQNKDEESEGEMEDVDGRVKEEIEDERDQRLYRNVGKEGHETGGKEEVNKKKKKNL